MSTSFLNPARPLTPEVVLAVMASAALTVELAGAYRVPATAASVRLCLLAAICVVAAFTDIRTLSIPAAITLGGMTAGLSITAVSDLAHLPMALVWTCVPALRVARLAGDRLRYCIGDVMLFAAIGSLAGWLVVPVIVVSVTLDWLRRHTLGPARGFLPLAPLTACAVALLPLYIRLQLW